MEKANHEVSLLCRVLKVQRSGYYAWCAREESKHERDDRKLAVEIKALFSEYRKRYGSPRICRELKPKVCRHRVARLMREHGLQARPRKKFVHTTDSAHPFETPPNILNRNFKVDAPNRVWAADVTYLPTKEGWFYLAVVLDLYSRMVVGWAMAERNDEELTMAALKIAIDQRRPEPKLLHHSDRGTTYASGGYQDLLAKHDMICSMSRKGNCWDNAVVESFFSTLDIECARQETFVSREAARREVMQYILGFYNPKRLHSSLGYMSPMEFERV